MEPEHRDGKMGLARLRGLQEDTGRGRQNHAAGWQRRCEVSGSQTFPAHLAVGETGLGLVRRGCSQVRDSVHERRLLPCDEGEY